MALATPANVRHAPVPKKKVPRREEDACVTCLSMTSVAPSRHNEFMIPTLLTLVLTPLQPTLATDPVGTDADDPAIWVDTRRPERSLIIGTDKTEFPGGGLQVHDLDGKMLQRISPLNRPNNVDVETGLRTPDGPIDLAVTTERITGRLRVFRIDPQRRRLSEVTGNTLVLPNETREFREIMGITLHRRANGRIFAIIAPKTGPTQGYLAMGELVFNSQTGKVDLEKVERFGRFSGKKEIEALFVDEETNRLYASDETHGVWMYDLDRLTEPNGLFRTEGFEGDHEGIAAAGDLLFSTDQIEGGSKLWVYPRRGTDFSAPLAVLTTASDETDGIEAYGGNLGPKFPEGILVMMNSKDKNFLVYDLRTIRGAIERR